MKPLYDFGLSQEDYRSECRTLGLPGGKILSVTSAGDMALSLLAAGAESVTAVDINPNQNHLAQLKLASVLTLPRLEAICFLGFLPASKKERLDWFRVVLPAMPAESQAFWLEQKLAVQEGALWLGQFERYLRRVLRLLKPYLTPRFQQLVACSSLEEQKQVFNRLFDTVLIRTVFRVAFNPKVYAKRGVDPQSLRYHDQKISLGKVYFKRFSNMCQNSLARENHYLQMFTLGRVLNVDCVPRYLQADGIEVIEKQHKNLSLVTADINQFLQEMPPESFDRFHLSNVPDWLNQPSFDALMHTIASRAKRPTKLLWRFIHVNRPLPSDLKQIIQLDSTLGHELEIKDRFPIYSLVPAFIPAATF